MIAREVVRFTTVIGLILAALLHVKIVVAAEEIVIDGQLFTVFPKKPSVFHPVVLQTEVRVCDGFAVLRTSVDNEAMVITVDYGYNGIEIDPCPPDLFGTRDIAIDGIRETGAYQIDFFESGVFQGSSELTVEESGPVYWIETPAEGSVQSGIGIVRGWACDADSVEIRFDDLPPQVVAYGDSRTDTLGACGDVNNGYGFVVGWGNLGLGSHRMRTFIDGVEVANVEFEVVGLQEPFIKGLTGSYELESFPNAGDSTTIQWSEPEQKFILIEKSP